MEEGEPRGFELRADGTLTELGPFPGWAVVPEWNPWMANGE